MANYFLNLERKNMTVQERLKKEIKSLNEQQLHDLEQYIAFLKYRSRFTISQSFDNNEIFRLYKKFSKEDIEFAEEGMDDYIAGLTKEEKLL
jgi:hypothetical protein